MRFYSPIMEIKRFFAKPQDVTQNEVVLRDGEFYHAVKVLRFKVGYRMVVCADGHTDIFAEVTDIGKDFLRAKIYATEENRTETEKRVTLYQCVAKETDFIVQKAVELGVKRFVPVISRYVNASVNTERLRKIILESSKQCGRASLMELSEPIPFSQAVAQAEKEEQLILFPYERADEGNIRDSVQSETQIGLFIGSEGGFSEDEAEALRKIGAKVVTLGKRILRAETAAVAALTLTLDSAGEM